MGARLIWKYNLTHCKAIAVYSFHNTLVSSNTYGLCGILCIKTRCKSNGQCSDSRHAIRLYSHHIYGLLREKYAWMRVLKKKKLYGLIWAIHMTSVSLTVSAMLFNAIWSCIILADVDNSMGIQQHYSQQYVLWHFLSMRAIHNAST